MNSSTSAPRKGSFAAHHRSNWPPSAFPGHDRPIIWKKCRPPTGSQKQRAVALNRSIQAATSSKDPKSSASISISASKHTKQKDCHGLTQKSECSKPFLVLEGFPMRIKQCL
eukprot:scaffold182077_cov29-Prasinocladus_malaysianus.AAC.1